MEITIHVYHHLAVEDCKDSSLASILAGIKRLELRMSQLDDAIAALTAQVTAEDTEIDSAIALIQGIPALIQAAVDKALSQGATPTQLQALSDLQSTITKKALDLATAVVSGTSSSGQTPSTS